MRAAVRRRGGSVVVADLYERRGQDIARAVPDGARRVRPVRCVRQGGLAALGPQLAVEYRPEVRVNTVVPGAILTPPWEAVPQAHHAATISATAAACLGGPDAVAAADASRASDASYITGVDLVVDGGWMVVKGSG